MAQAASYGVCAEMTCYLLVALALSPVALIYGGIAYLAWDIDRHNQRIRAYRRAFGK